ncbi:hypothetical protein JOB18_021296 [Solea senegalensis]|uniref:Uncharacterized protein n=1 Tax=Solea senegalensis TaxID=28829 RepID=A0AAV6QUC5_SOLSE|nr:hypothetical protein JOB18_021296 [Solea senegalensis]
MFNCSQINLKRTVNKTSEDLEDLEDLEEHQQQQQEVTEKKKSCPQRVETMQRRRVFSQRAAAVTLCVLLFMATQQVCAAPPPQVRSSSVHSPDAHGVPAVRRVARMTPLWRIMNKVDTAPTARARCLKSSTTERTPARTTSEFANGQREKHQQEVHGRRNSPPDYDNLVESFYTVLPPLVSVDTSTRNHLIREIPKSDELV